MKMRAKVIQGVQIGAKFGIATANLELAALPAVEEGVYLVEVEHKSQHFNGLLHFGPRKTFGGDLSAEVHILDFNQDIYGETIALNVLTKLRDVVAFKNADALFTQIEKDITQARKYFLRRHIWKHWQSLSLSDQARLSEQAIEHLSATSEFLEAETLFVYAPMREREIAFIAQLMAAFPEKKYAFPKVHQDQMAFYVVQAYEDLQEGAFGILEPRETNAVEPQSSDLMLLPAVAVDRKGNRLGQGGGFYDRYLALLKTDPKRLVVVPDFAVGAEIPTEKHDQGVDRVIACSL